jgi:ketosteroid isomerase-like protein
MTTGTASNTEASPRAVIESVYTLLAAGDVEGFAALMAPDIVWREAEGNPYADLNPYIGPEAVLTGLFARLLSDWDNFTATPHESVVEGNRVVVFGRYGETWKPTGQVLDIPFVHSWTVEDGQLLAFQQYTDTNALVTAMASRATTESHSQEHHMARLIAFHEVEDGDHWVGAWHGGAGSRQEMFGRIGVTARIFRDPEHPNVTGLIFQVPDMDRFQSFMATDEVARAMKEDRLKVETVRVLGEITP